MRDYTNTQTLIEGDEAQAVGSFDVRPVTLASMLMLKKLNNPLYAAMVSGAEVDPTAIEPLVEFIWVHVADWQRSQRACSPSTV